MKKEEQVVVKPEEKKPVLTPGEDKSTADKNVSSADEAAKDDD
jgi:hypothetical protein